jgi:hypothetical protein
MSTATDIISNSLLEIGKLAQGETANAGDVAWGLSKLNRMIDAWNARRLFIFAVNFVETYTLTPGLIPHTIGPSSNIPAPNFATVNGSTRPARIESAAIILNNINPKVTQPLNPRDADWWANERIKTLQTDLPTEFYYEPDYPLGKIFLWPVPITAWGLELQTWTEFNKFTTSTTITLPQGYEDAITWSLAETMMASYRVQADRSAEIRLQARSARAVIQSINAKTPLIASRDYGMPHKGSFNRTNWNYTTGLTTKT